MLVLTPNHAIPSTLSQLHSTLSNPLWLPHPLAPWTLDVRVYKSTSDNKFLYQVSTTSQGQRDAKVLLGGKVYPTGGSSTDGVINDPLDSVIQSKLQSQWTWRQTLVGDSGFTIQIYLRGVKVVIRATNVFLQGNFRCLLVIVEGIASNEASVEMLKQILGLGDTNVVFGDSLEQGMVEALGLN